MSARAIVWPLWLTVAACFPDVSYRGTSFLCRRGGCPDGFECQDGRCCPSGSDCTPDAGDLCRANPHGTPQQNARSVGVEQDVLYQGTSASVDAGCSLVRIGDGQPVAERVGRGDRLFLDGAELYVAEVVGPTEILVQGLVGDALDGSLAIERAYSSVQAWYDERGGNLIADGRRETAVLFADGPLVESADLVDSTTNDLHYLELTADARSRHTGRTGTGVIVDGQLEGRVCWTVSVSHTRIDGVAFARCAGDSGVAAIEIVGGTEVAGVQISSVHVYDYLDADFSVSGVVVDQNGVGAVIRNSFFSDGDQAAVRSNDVTASVTVQNCTVYRMDGRGLWEDEGQLSAENVLVLSTGSDGFDVVNGSQTHNASSDGTAAGSGSLTGLSVGAELLATDVGDPDLHLAPGAQSRGAGVNLSAQFSDDIDGEPRSGAWDIGADQHTP